MMSFLVIGNIPLMYFLNKDWYNTRSNPKLLYALQPLGQVIITICAVAIFVSTAFVIKLTQPIEYRR